MTALLKKSVVVPIDFSHFGDGSLKAALPYVARPQDLHVIHVVSAVKTGEIWHDSNAQDRLRAAEQTLQQFLEKHGYQDLAVVVRAGDPGTEITKYAEEVSADLIVIPSHGVNSALQFFLGSVAERVVRSAHCPVLVLRDGRSSGK